MHIRFPHTFNRPDQCHSFHLITRAVSVVGYRLWRSYLCILLHSPVISTILSTVIFTNDIVLLNKSDPLICDHVQGWEIFWCLITDRNLLRCYFWSDGRTFQTAGSSSPSQHGVTPKQGFLPAALLLAVPRTCQIPFCCNALIIFSFQPNDYTHPFVLINTKDGKLWPKRVA
jgi:hypothetical protein